MRLTDYYAQQIHGFFVGWGLDAIDGDRTAEASVVEKPNGDDAGALDRDYAVDAFDTDCVGCSCHLIAPCDHCVDNHDETGCEATNR